MVFILMQSVTLGLVAGAIVGVQIVLIPRLRRRLLVLGRARQLTARQLAGRVGEIVEGITGVRLNDTSNWERAEVSGRLAQDLLHPLRHLPVEVPGQIHQQPPRPGHALRLLPGRRLSRDHRPPRHRPARRGHRRLQGAAVAAEGPDRLGSAAARRAGEVHAGRRAVHDRQDPRPGAAEARADDADAHRARDRGERRHHPRRVRRDAAGVVVREARARARPSPRSGRSAPAASIWRKPSPALPSRRPGRILLDGTPIETLPDSVTGRRIGYAEANTYFPQASLRDSLDLWPSSRAAAADGEGLRARTNAGSSRHAPPAIPETDVVDDWIDYEAAGATGPEDLLERLREVLVIVDLENDVYRLGLRSRMPEAQLAELSSRILAARDDLRERLAKSAGRALCRDVRPGPLRGERLGQGELDLRRCRHGGARRAAGRPPLHGVDHRGDGARGKARHHGP